MFDFMNLDYTSHHHIYLMCLGAVVGYLLKAMLQRRRDNKPGAKQDKMVAAIALEHEKKMRTIAYEHEQRMKAIAVENEDEPWNVTSPQEEQDSERKTNQEEITRRKELNDVGDPVNQLRFIKNGSYYSRKPVNKEAAVHAFMPLMDYVKTVTDSKSIVLAEVSLSAFIKPKKKTFKNKWLRERAFFSYCAKRVDFLIIDRYGDPKVAIEYDGTGHRSDEKTKLRRDVKKQMLNHVGIPLIIIPEKTKVSEYFDQITPHL